MIAKTKEALISQKRRRDIRNSTEEGTANEASKKKGKKDLETPKIVEIFDHVEVTNKKNGSKDVIKMTNEQKTAEGSTSKATTKEDEGPKTKEPKEAVTNNDQREIIEKVSNEPQKQRENETAGTMNPSKVQHTAPLRINSNKNGLAVQCAMKTLSEDVRIEISLGDMLEISPSCRNEFLKECRPVSNRKMVLIGQQDKFEDLSNDDDVSENFEIG